MDVTALAIGIYENVYNIAMSFGYFPDFKGKNKPADLLLSILGYPYPPRRNEARLVFKELKPANEDKILDVGCGDGVFTNDLIKQGYDVTGLDVMEGAIKKAKERAAKMGLRAKYAEASAGKMPFEENTFDKIFSISTFEHIKDEENAFNECFRVLKPEGIFVLSVPTPKIMPIIKVLIKLPPKIKKLLFNSVLSHASTPKQYRQLADKKYTHYQTYTEDQLVSKLEKRGFKINKINYNIKFFSILPHSIIHSLKFFEWNKDNKNKYSFASELAIVTTFPFFYPFYLADDILSSKGYS